MRTRYVVPTNEAVPVEESHAIVTRAWDPAQLVAFAIGIVVLIIGAIGLARTGIHFDHLDVPHHAVAGMGHSPLMGGSEVIFGLLMLLAGASGLRSLFAFLSVVALGFGVIVVAHVARTDLQRWLGVHDRSGWFYIVVGAIGLLACAVIPRVSSTRADSRIVR